MENQTETLALESNPATLPAPKPAKKPVSYSKRISKMSDRQLQSELRAERRNEYGKANYHGVILATVLDVLMDSHKSGKYLYPR